jgi:hypothetical protein
MSITDLPLMLRKAEMYPARGLLRNLDGRFIAGSGYRGRMPQGRTSGFSTFAVDNFVSSLRKGWLSPVEEKPFAVPPKIWPEFSLA